MRSLLVCALLVSAGCDNDEINTCSVLCTADEECPPGQTCSAVGRCTSGDVCPCTPGEFLGCVDDTARFCNASADGPDNEECGLPGCNAEAGRCNACVANTIACSADLASLDDCGSDGLVSQSDACAAGCAPGSPGLSPDRCKHITPAWLPDVCTEPASNPDASLGSATLDVAQDASCTGGVVEVNGTSFCIVRAAKITIGDLKVAGTRAIAFVADDELTVSGTLDISADGQTPGPGAGVLGAGAASLNNSYRGGGGAGFAQIGGAGGGNETGTEAGMAGGPSTERLTTARFLGGATTTASQCGSGIVACLNAIDFPGGGGGGGALLIACRGTVSVTGTIDAGGGGGTGGGDHYPAAGAVAQGGGPGGGSGGFVAFQGAHVEITGKLYANGGGGGAACSGDNCRGNPGSDGLRSKNGAPGGDSAGNSCGGGIGGSVSTAPGPGERTFAAASAGGGGGGGSIGRFQVFVPSGVTPVVTPAEASPSPDATLTIAAE